MVHMHIMAFYYKCNFQEEDNWWKTDFPFSSPLLAVWFSKPCINSNEFNKVACLYVSMLGKVHVKISFRLVNIGQHATSIKKNFTVQAFLKIALTFLSDSFKTRYFQKHLQTATYTTQTQPSRLFSEK